MNILQYFSDFLKQHSSQDNFLKNLTDDLRPKIDFTKNPDHGDFTTNIAMVLAKSAKMPPHELAQKIIPLLEAHPQITKIEIAGAGFINWQVSEDFWHQIILTIHAQNKNYGRNQNGKWQNGKWQNGKRQKVNVEYVSANPTGPLHVGHVRGAVFGDILASLFEANDFDVTREYYLNDAGGQIHILVKSLHYRYQELFNVSQGAFPEDCYPGAYLIEIAKTLKNRDGDKWLNMLESDYFEALRRFVIDLLVQNIKDDLKSLNIEMDFYNSEQHLIETGKTDAVIKLLSDKNLLYYGCPPPPKGRQLEDWQTREQLLFKSTDFGDDTDRALKKADGSYTYFANDIAGHYDKYQRGFAYMIDIWGADHGGYIKRMQAAIKAFSDNEAKLDIALMQIVRLIEKGEIVKMSKRSGSFVTLKDMIARVGNDAVRFTMMMRDNNAHMDFDFDLVTKQSNDNPVFYVQYACARICSVKRLVQTQFPEEDLDTLSEAEMKTLLPLLKDAREIAIIKKCAQFPIIIEQAAQKLQPHLLGYYLYELAESFHRLWSAGNRDVNLRFLINDDLNLTKSRLLLAQTLLIVLQNGLNIMKISAPEKL